MYSLKRQNIVENKSNLFARVNENKNIIMLNKQFSADGNWLCLSLVWKIRYPVMLFIKRGNQALSREQISSGENCLY